jgi:hypothetical protein
MDTTWWIDQQQRPQLNARIDACTPNNNSVDGDHERLHDHTI